MIRIKDIVTFEQWFQTWGSCTLEEFQKLLQYSKMADGRSIRASFKVSLFPQIGERYIEKKCW